MVSRNIINREINGLDDIEGFKIKCSICKEYKLIKDTRGVRLFNLKNHICKECRGIENAICTKA